VKTFRKIKIKLNKTNVKIKIIFLRAVYTKT